MAGERIRYLSLFSGIEAVSVAWKNLNFEPVAFAEVEPFCNALLEHHFPDIPNLGDVSEITESDINNLGRIDLVIFGSPCQDLSIAGIRQGLSGERSGLFRQAVRLIQYARIHCGCRIAIWENVPGCFSSNKGRDFSEVLRLLTGDEQPPPDKGWKTGGAAFGPESLCEWRVLDAQFFGVPQRRRRVFIVADFGDWTDRRPVLFESEGMCRNTETCRAQREDIAGPLEARTSSGGFPGTDGSCANHVIYEHLPKTVGTVDSEYGCSKLNHQSMLQGHVLPVPYDLQAHGKYGRGDKARSLKQRDWKDATDLVVIPIHDFATRHSGKRDDKQDGKGNGLGVGSPGDPMNTLTAGDKHAVAYQYFYSIHPHCIGRKPENGPRGKEWMDHQTGYTMDATGVLQAVCFQQNQREEVRLIGGDGQVAGSLPAQPGMKNNNYICDIDLVVRRLTPLECERLQGFPDNWTCIPWKGKQADHCPVTPRYKSIGNSMAVPVITWLGQRVEQIIYV